MNHNTTSPSSSSSSFGNQPRPQQNQYRRRRRRRYSCVGFAGILESALEQWRSSSSLLQQQRGHSNPAVGGSSNNPTTTPTTTNRTNAIFSYACTRPQTAGYSPLGEWEARHLVHCIQQQIPVTTRKPRDDDTDTVAAITVPNDHITTVLHFDLFCGMTPQALRVLADFFQQRQYPIQELGLVVVHKRNHVDGNQVGDPNPSRNSLLAVREEEGEEEADADTINHNHSNHTTTSSSSSHADTTMLVQAAAPTLERLYISLETNDDDDDETNEGRSQEPAQSQQSQSQHPSRHLASPHALLYAAGPGVLRHVRLFSTFQTLSTAGMRLFANALGRFRHLHTLQLSFLQLTDAGLQYLVDQCCVLRGRGQGQDEDASLSSSCSLSSLERLDLEFISGLTHHALPALTRLLRINGRQYGNDQQQRQQQQSQLRSIKLQLGNSPTLFSTKTTTTTTTTTTTSQSHEQEDCIISNDRNAAQSAPPQPPLQLSTPLEQFFGALETCTTVEHLRLHNVGLSGNAAVLTRFFQALERRGLGVNQRTTTATNNNNTIRGNTTIATIDLAEDCLFPNAAVTTAMMQALRHVDCQHLSLVEHGRGGDDNFLNNNNSSSSSSSSSNATLLQQQPVAQAVHSNLHLTRLTLASGGRTLVTHVGTGKWNQHLQWILNQRNPSLHKVRRLLAVSRRRQCGGEEEDDDAPIPAALWPWVLSCLGCSAGPDPTWLVLNEHRDELLLFAAQ